MWCVDCCALCETFKQAVSVLSLVVVILHAGGPWAGKSVMSLSISADLIEADQDLVLEALRS